MKRLIMLKSIGMTGKSYTVNRLLLNNPRWVHIAQSNRDYFKLHPEVDPQKVDELDLYEFFSKNLFAQKIEDNTYITERTPLDYLIYNEYRHFFKKDLTEFKFADGTNYIDRVYEDEYKFCTQFDQVDIYVSMNLDLKWMDEYFHTIAKDDIHKLFYKGRGYFILYQDNWMKSFMNHSDVYVKIDKAINNLNISEFEFWNFIEDNNKFNSYLVSKYNLNKK